MVAAVCDGSEARFRLDKYHTTPLSATRRPSVTFGPIAFEDRAGPWLLRFALSLLDLAGEHVWQGGEPNKA